MRPRPCTWPSAVARPCDAQEASQLERLPLSTIKDPIQGLAPRVLEDELRPPFVTSERQRPSGPCRIKIGGERVLVLEPPQALRRRLFCGERHRQDREWVAVLPAAVQGELPAFPQSLQHKSRTHRHGWP